MQYAYTIIIYYNCKIAQLTVHTDVVKPNTTKLHLPRAKVALMHKHQSLLKNLVH